MTDHDLILSLNAQIAAHLGAPVISPPLVVTPPQPIVVPAGVEMLTFSTASRATKIQVTPGGLYAVKLPKIPAGGTSITRDPASPPNMNVEMAYSRTPGDFTWAMTQTFHYPFMPTVPFYPGISLGSIESNTLHFGPVIGQNTAQIDPVQEDWYMNLRVFNATGPLIYWYTVN